LSSLPSLTKKQEFKEKNSITSVGNEISYGEASKKYRTLLWEGSSYPCYQNSGSTTGNLTVRYLKSTKDADGNYEIDTTNSCIIKGITVKGQGSTAKTYYKWNGSWSFKDSTVYCDIYGNEVEDHGYWQYCEEDSSTGEVTAVTPKATKLVGKLNYASSMQSHKQGALRMYEDIRNTLGYKSAIQKTKGLELSRMSVREDEFLFFVQTPNDSAPVFYGLMTWGAAKGDELTYGYDKEKTPEMLMVGGSNQECPITLCHSPWLDDECYFDGKEEFLFHRLNDSNGASTQEAFDLELGNADSIVYIQDYLNFVYSNSYRLIGCSATSISNVSSVSNLDKTYQYWFVDSSDGKYKVARYDYTTYKWVHAGITKNSEGKTIKAECDLLSDLDGYFTETLFMVNKALPSTYSGFSGCSGSMTGNYLEAFNKLSLNDRNTILKRARAAKLRDKIGEYCDIKDILLCFCYTLFIAASDNLSKNSYFLVDKTATTTGRPLIRPWRDDDDTIFRINNEGMKDKPYWAELYTTHKNAQNTTVSYFTANNSGYYGTLFYAYLQDFIDRNVLVTPSIRSVTSDMLGAMSSLGSSYVIDNDSIMGCFNRYFLSIQNYIPAVAYNETARLLYEEAEILNANGVEAYNYGKNPHPITMSMGDCLQGEMQYLKMRIFFMKTFAMYSGGLNKFGYMLSGGTNNVTVKAAAHMYVYSMNTEDETNTNHPTLLSPGNTTRLYLNTGGSTSVTSIVGIDYMSDIGDWSNKIINAAATTKVIGFTSKRCTSFVGGSTSPSFNATSFGNTTLLPSVIEKLDLRNMTYLTGRVDLSNYYRLKYVYLLNTSVSNLILPQSNSLTTVTLPSSSNLANLTVNKAPNCNFKQLNIKNYIGLEKLYITCLGDESNENDYFGNNFDWIKDWYNNGVKYKGDSWDDSLTERTFVITNINWYMTLDEFESIHTILSKLESFTLQGTIHITDYVESIADKMNSIWPGYNEVKKLSFEFVNPYNTIFGPDVIENTTSSAYTLATYDIDISGNVTWNVTSSYVYINNTSNSGCTVQNIINYQYDNEQIVILSASFVDSQGVQYNPTKEITLKPFVAMESGNTSIVGEYILDETLVGDTITYTLSFQSTVNKPYCVVWSLDDNTYLDSDELVEPDSKPEWYYYDPIRGSVYGDCKGDIASITLNCVKLPSDTKTIRLYANVYDTILTAHGSNYLPTRDKLLFTLSKTLYLGEKALDTFGWIYCSDGSLVSNIDEIPTGKNPIGICVVPRRHTLRLANESYSGTDKSYAGTARIMSLNEMNYNTPDVGTSGTSRCGIYWGGYATLDIPELINKYYMPNILGNLIYDWARIGSETNYNGYLKYQREDGLYYWPDTAEERISQNPFVVTDGVITDEPNSKYVYDENRTNVATTDLDGAGNTEKILKYAVSQQYWQISDTIRHSYQSGYYPAACCCWRYHVDGDAGVLGTQQGDWYLPAAGELGYLIPRFGKLQTLLTEIKTKFPDSQVLSLYSTNYYWSSSEYNSYLSWNLNTYGGYLYYYYNKGSDFYVRAFLAV
jgi:hypothetical protein